MPLSSGYSSRRYSSLQTPSSLRRLRESSELNSSYNVVPTRRLNIVSSGRLSERENAKSTPGKESRRVRKKREWLKRQELIKTGTLPEYKRRYGGDWGHLPYLVLVKIFQYIPYQHKLNAAMTCSHWSKMVYVNSIWSKFVVDDSTFTTSRYNYAGKFYEEVLNHVKASRALLGLAPKLKNLSFIPSKNLHVVVCFQQLITKYCQMNGPLDKIESFTYVFPCDFARKSNEIDIYGTGGTILQDMKDLLSFLPGIKRLELKDLELDSFDAMHVLDEVSQVCCEKIQNLKVINISRAPLPMLAIATFINLRDLTISPQNLSDDLVECFGDMLKLRNVQILNNAYTESPPISVDYRVWRACRRSNPRLKVHLVTEGKHRNEIVFQNKAPVRSIVYENPYSKVSTLSINLAIEMYGSDLEIYAHRRLPRFHTAKKFSDRPDSAYLYLLRQCPYIHTLFR